LFFFIYIKFLLKSTNAHGVHSPFVYDIVTQCFYKKNKHTLLTINIPRSLKKRHIKTLNDFFLYLKIQRAIFFIKEHHFIKQIPSFKNIVIQNEERQDLVYIDEAHFIEQKINTAFDLLHEDGLIVIELPYKKTDLWRRVKKHSKVQVVIDVYFFGFVFLKKNQAKEVFFIRL